MPQRRPEVAGDRPERCFAHWLTHADKCCHAVDLLLCILEQRLVSDEEPRQSGGIVDRSVHVSGPQVAPKPVVILLRSASERAPAAGSRTQTTWRIRG